MQYPNWSRFVNGMFDGYHRDTAALVTRLEKSLHVELTNPLVQEQQAVARNVVRTGRQRFDDLMWALKKVGKTRSYDQQRFHNEFIVGTLPHIFRHDLEANFEWVCKMLNITSIKKQLIVITPRRFGKCLGERVRVFLYSGAVIEARDVRSGTLLVGPDSQPRFVTSMASGCNTLYNISCSQSKATFTCNSDHILVLQHRQTHELIQISVTELITSSTVRRVKRISHYEGIVAPEWTFPDLAVVHCDALHIGTTDLTSLLHELDDVDTACSLSDCLLKLNYPNRLRLANALFVRSAYAADEKRNTSVIFSFFDQCTRHMLVSLFASVGMRVVEGLDTITVHPNVHTIQDDDVLTIKMERRGLYVGWTCAAFAESIDLSQQTALLSLYRDAQQPLALMQSWVRSGVLVSEKKTVKYPSKPLQCKNAHPSTFVLANGLVTHNTYCVGQYIAATSFALEGYGPDPFTQCIYAPAFEQSRRVLELSRRFLTNLPISFGQDNTKRLHVKGPFGPQDERIIYAYPSKVSPPAHKVVTLLTQLHHDCQCAQLANLENLYKVRSTQCKKNRMLPTLQRHTRCFRCNKFFRPIDNYGTLSCRMHPALPGVRDIGGDIENEGVYPCCGAKVQWTANDARASGNSEAYTKGCLRVSHAEWQSDLDAHEIEISLEVAQLVAQHANIQPIGLFPLVDSPNVLVIRRSDQLDEVYEEMEPRQEPV